MYLPKKCSQVLEDDVASPAQLAKAYMGSRPSKVSPSMLGFRSQALREDSTLPSNILFPPSIVPKSPAPVGISEKGTMKVCCGKNMTRHSFTLLLVFQSSLLCLSVRDVYGGPSSSQSALEQNRIYGSKKEIHHHHYHIMDFIAFICSY